MELTIATMFTLIRILLTPCILYALIAHAWIVALILITVAGLTDLLDGLIARWLQQETVLGALLDPIADKLLLVSCYVTLLMLNLAWFCIPDWFVTLILVREAIIVVGAWFIGQERGYCFVRPTLMGKCATALQLLLLGLMLLSAVLHVKLGMLFDMVFVSVVICVIGSLLHYIFLGLQGVLAWRVK